MESIRCRRGVDGLSWKYFSDEASVMLRACFPRGDADEMGMIHGSAVAHRDVGSTCRVRFNDYVQRVSLSRCVDYYKQVPTTDTTCGIQRRFGTRHALPVTQAYTSSIHTTARHPQSPGRYEAGNSPRWPGTRPHSGVDSLLS